MENELFEIEKILIEEYNNTRKTIKELKLIKSYYPDSFSALDMERLNSAHISEIDLNKKLKSLVTKPVTKAKVQTLISQLHAIIEALKENEYGLCISRSQGLIFETAIYGMIISDINWAFNSYFYSWSNPYYYYDSESKFDHSELKKVLIDFRQSLIGNQPENFIDLEKKVEQCISTIKELAENDYKQNILTRSE